MQEESNKNIKNTKNAENADAANAAVKQAKSFLEAVLVVLTGGLLILVVLWVVIYILLLVPGIDYEEIGVDVFLPVFFVWAFITFCTTAYAKFIAVKGVSDHDIHARLLKLANNGLVASIIICLFVFPALPFISTTRIAAFASVLSMFTPFAMAVSFVMLVSANVRHYQKKVYSKSAHISPDVSPEVQKNIDLLNMQVKYLLVFGGVAMLLALLNLQAVFESIRNPVMGISLVFVAFPILVLPGIALAAKACVQLKQIIVAYRRGQFAEIKAPALRASCILGAIFTIVAVVLFIAGPVISFTH